MANAAPTTTPEHVAREYADRIVLEQLTELHEAVKPGEISDRLKDRGIGLGTVRSLLSSNPEKFAYHERRWVPAARVAGVGLPIAEAIRLAAERFGGPMPAPLLALEVSRVYGLDTEVAERIVARIASSDDTLLLTKDGRVATSGMVFTAGDESRDRALALNQVEADEVERVAKVLAKLDWLNGDAIVSALDKAAPVSAKVLGAVAWCALNPEDPQSEHHFDWRAFNAELLSVPGFVYGADGTIYPETTVKDWLAKAAKVAEKAKAVIEIEDAAPLELKKANVEKMVKQILASNESVAATSILENEFEITPSVKTFPDDLATVIAALRAESGLLWVGGDRFRKAGTAAEGIEDLPAPFLFANSDLLDEEGEMVDVELTDDGLSTSLRKLIEHPLATDVNDEDYHAAPKNQPDSMRLVLKPIHRELGTFPLSQFPTDWFQGEPKIQELVWRTDEGEEHSFWLNNERRLIFGLIDLWLDQPVESGAVFTLSRTEKPNVFDFAWLGQNDPVVYISSQRMEELREIAGESEGKSTYQIVREVIAHWPKGVDFLTLLWEVNVVRRSSRRMLASLLSGYVCFYQRSGSPVWHYDHKKVDQGFDKTKRKFVKKD
ncbi:MAG: hypothetical protein IT207_11250 [Fimbriimonadaceae bacterium]|nr:hypothetical protein [Fimbriimonadaceae bacterium]